MATDPLEETHEPVLGNAPPGAFGPPIVVPTTPTLHGRIKAAINHRLTLAEGASSGDWPSIVGIVEGDSPFVAPDRVTEHIAANDPAFTIRACRADLERLNEHAPKRTAMEKWAPPDLNGLLVDWLCAGHGLLRGKPYPCPEVLRLAAVYGIEVDP